MAADQSKSSSVPRSSKPAWRSRRRIVVRGGHPTAGMDAGMDLDQFALLIEPNEGAVAADPSLVLGGKVVDGSE